MRRPRCIFRTSVGLLEYWTLQYFAVEAYTGDHLRRSVSAARSAVDARPAGSIARVKLEPNSGVPPWREI
eukprot:14503840-Alexandrium_andersonii.AAC.1